MWFGDGVQLGARRTQALVQRDHGRLRSVSLRLRLVARPRRCIQRGSRLRRNISRIGQRRGCSLFGMGCLGQGHACGVQLVGHLLAPGGDRDLDRIRRAERHEAELGCVGAHD